MKQGHSLEMIDQYVSLSREEIEEIMKQMNESIPAVAESKIEYQNGKEKGAQFSLLFF